MRKASVLPDIFIIHISPALAVPFDALSLHSGAALYFARSRRACVRMFWVHRLRPLWVLSCAIDRAVFGHCDQVLKLFLNFPAMNFTQELLIQGAEFFRTLYEFLRTFQKFQVLLKMYAHVCISMYCHHHQYDMDTCYYILANIFHSHTPCNVLNTGFMDPNE